jgi:hypothetical protein
MPEFFPPVRRSLFLLLITGLICSFGFGVRRLVAAFGFLDDRNATNETAPAKATSPQSPATDRPPQPRSTIPEFMSGDECLFCHRNDVGASWPQNRHGGTIRPADPEMPSIAALAESPITKSMASDVEFVLGGTRRERFLKRSNQHGRLDLLSVAWNPPRADTAGRLVGDTATWDAGKFGSQCAGCHSTAVDAKTGAFAALSLDCFVCHGVIPENHTTEPALAYFSKKRQGDARTTVSICGQCHIRTGTAKSTGRPYPTHFVAGDDLFRDFQVDFSDEQIGKLNPADAHVLANIRDVIVHGKEAVTCLSCHTVHKPSGFKHHRVANSAICSHCHEPDSKKHRKAFDVHSPRCEY